MANKKLKNFEFAYHSEKGNSKQANTDEMLFFECENGSVFLICQDSTEHNLEVSPATLAAQRIKYYLENEFVAQPNEALFNALVYTNGFIYEYGRKHDDYSEVYVHCACVLIRENKVYYAATGELAAYFFNRRRPVLICHGTQGSIASSTEESTDGVSSKAGQLLGHAKLIHPIVNKDALVPLNEDMLLLCSRGFYEKVNEKSMQKILEDPMPVQTKVYRLVDMASIAGGEENISLQLISFYNLDHRERKFVAADLKKPKEGRKKPEVVTLDVAENEDLRTEIERGKLDELQSFMKTPVMRSALIALAVLILGYMFYDLFIRDPMPPVRIDTPQRQAIVAEEAEKQENDRAQEPQAVSHVNIPKDTVYTVRSGDTWGQIYTRFGVCSWFIRNHQSNAGKFDNDDNPVAGTRLQIPLLYSARRELNPDFYQEFSTQKTGSRCENANQSFIDRFRAAHLN